MSVRPIIRSFLPSIFELLVGLMVSLAIIGLHILILSVNGRAYPTAINDVLLQGYANYIVGPLASFLQNGLINAALLTMLWAVGGFVVYELLVWVISSLASWRETRHAIANPREGVTILHPQQQSFLISIARRCGIIILTLLYSIAILPVVHQCLVSDERLLAASAAGDAAILVATTVLLWMAMMHGYVVLLRWYMLRARISGDILR